MKNVTVATPSRNVSQASINKAKWFESRVKRAEKSTMDVASMSKIVNRMVQAKRRSRSGVI